MKISKIVFLSAMLLAGLVSCKKDEGLQNMNGTWIGSWGFANLPRTNYEHWSLEKNGELTSYFPDGSIYATGTWECEDDEFEATYTTPMENHSYSFSGFIDDDQIVGTWGEAPSAIDGGTFEMEKQ